ncbi:MAG: acetylxylan esterase, partial [Pirellulaceae bacterium]|nr:acetylxylan esterase [Pirellulaceae bacterium]
MPQSDPSREFLSFVQQQALQMRKDDAPSKSLEQWKSQRLRLRRQLIRSLGGFPREHAPLNPRVVGEFQRDGYRVQRIVLQTRPGIEMTANAYVPAGGGKHPAVLCVHGHWRGAKQEPTVQRRCMGLAKLGFFVLAVDAFGAGERGIGKALGEYHGEMVAGTLWPTGLSLAGLQVYENMRAVDYLQSRPEVDGDKIGVTGTSGGGNQTMYAGALEERFKCVVPACSVGTYQSYLGAACCMCEVTPGAMTYTEEAGVLALVAPRALMLINASRDAFQFSIGEAKKSIDNARPIFRLYGRAENARHATFESKHDYNQPMREAMYGWMTLHLKGEGDGEPIAEPKIQDEDPETLRCFPDDSRPATFVTLPQFAAQQARQLLARRAIPDHAEGWDANNTLMRESLPRVLGRFPKPTALGAKVKTDGKTSRLTIAPEPGVRVEATLRKGEKKRGLAVVLDLDRGRAAETDPVAKELLAAQWDVATVDLRATGETANKGDKIGRAPDHNSAEWSMWIGRPLLGQWAWDVRRLLDAIGAEAGGLPESVALVGIGPASLVALVAAALDRRVDRAATLGGLASF